MGRVGSYLDTLDTIFRAFRFLPRATKRDTRQRARVPIQYSTVQYNEVLLKDIILILIVIRDEGCYLYIPGTPYCAAVMVPILHSRG